MLHGHRIIDFYHSWDIIKLIISLGGYAMAEFCLKCFNELNGTDTKPMRFGWRKTSARAASIGNPVS